MIGLAATVIGLMPQNLLPSYLGELNNPVLQDFDDTEPLVRYYACESMFNTVTDTVQPKMIHNFGRLAVLGSSPSLLSLAGTCSVGTCSVPES